LIDTRNLNRQIAVCMMKKKKILIVADDQPQFPGTHLKELGNTVNVL
jgi:hypothetical protein